MPEGKIEIWVTGLGCISAAGASVEQNMHGLHTGLRPQVLPAMFPDAAEQNPVCLVKNDWIQTAGYTWPKHSAADSAALAFIAAAEAVGQAGFIPDSSAKLGVSVGTVTGASLYFFNTYKNLRANLPVSEAIIHEPSDFIYGNLACLLAKKYQASGPLLTAANACTSSADAIGSAMEWLSLGLCDQALAGGTDSLSFISYCGFNRLLIYSDEACCPFDKNRKGLNLGEGAAMLFLERSTSAQARGAKALAKIVGYGAGSDAYHFTAPSPEGRGLGWAIKKAMAQAGITPQDLAFVNAHGTATLENDKVEAALFNDILPEVPIWGSKGVTGHCLGAAGAIEAVFSISALASGMVPPTVGCVEPEDNIRDSIVLKARPITKRYALSVSAGFGGGNAALVFELPGACDV